MKSTTPHTFTPRLFWNWRKLLVCHLLLAFMIGSFFCPFTKKLWDALDTGVFRFLNGSLRDHPWWQVFWALANHPWADWVTDICFLSFFTAAVLALPKEKRLHQIAHIIFCCLYIGCIIYFVNRILFRRHLHIPRPSPTLVFPDSLKLSHVLTWLKIKDVSKQSFPGDHGTTAILFAASYAFFAPRHLKFLGWLYGVFLCLPRLMTGAHWLSDIILGSGSIALLFLSWAFYTPLGWRCSDFLHRAFIGMKSSKRSLKTSG